MWHRSHAIDANGIIISPPPGYLIYIERQSKYRLANIIVLLLYLDLIIFSNCMAWWCYHHVRQKILIRSISFWLSNIQYHDFSLSAVAFVVNVISVIRTCYDSSTTPFLDFYALLSRSHFCLKISSNRRKSTGLVPLSERLSSISFWASYERHSVLSKESRFHLLRFIN